MKSADCPKTEQSLAVPSHKPVPVSCLSQSRSSIAHADPKKIRPKVEFILRFMFTGEDDLDDITEAVEHIVDENGRVGAMIRSADEWEMSRSCQEKTFSRNIPWPRMTHAPDQSIFQSRWIAFVRHRWRTLLPLGKTLRPRAARAFADREFQSPYAR